MNELEQWFQERPAWLKCAANNILGKGELEEDDYKELVELCIKEAKGEITDQDNCDITFSFDKTSNVSIRLDSIDNIHGINALAPKNPLEFGKSNLSIIYGQNGSGKSGYVRILKHICGARLPGKLLPNVFENEQVDQKCDITFEVNGIKKTITWKKNSQSIEDLKTIDIYDISNGKIYVNNENEVTYEPPLLNFFSDLNAVSEVLSGKIEELINQKTSKLPAIPQNIQETEISKWYDKLTHKISDKSIDRSTAWNKKDQKKLKELRERLSTESPAEQAKKVATKKQRLDNLIVRTIHHVRQLSDIACKRIFELNIQATLKEEAAKTAAEKIFETAPLSGIGTPIWEQLWQKAREYSEEIAYPNDTFPVTKDGARCVLCHQPLSDKAKDRLVSFEEYVKGQLRIEAQGKRNEYDKAIESLKVVDDAETLTTNLEAIGIDKNELTDQLQQLCNVLRQRQQKITSVDNIEQLPSIPKSWELLKKARHLSSDYYSKSEQYKKDAKDDNRLDLSNEAKELEAKEWISKQKEAIKEEVQRLQQIGILKSAKRLTNTMALSKKKNSLAEELITDAYIERFNDELTKLDAYWIQVELVKTGVSKGKVLHKIQLKKAHKQVPDEILSDGENRIVTLAAFLADVTGKTIPAPFVFDDPITSLDEDFEEAVVNRLVELSKDRQVIVFTHRLSLTGLLDDASKKAGKDAHFISIRKESWGTGNPGDVPINVKKPHRVLNDLMNSRLSQARKKFEGDGRQVYEPLAKAICSDFRILLERMIEDVLLSNVVHRFRRALNTQGKIKNLSKITDSDCEYFDRMMTKYSKYEHSQPYSTPVQLPNPDELENDLKGLKKWYENFNDR